MRLTQADVDKLIVIGSDPLGDEVYPEQVAKVKIVHLLDDYDDVPGDADWAEVYLEPMYRIPDAEWISEGDPWKRTKDDGRRNMGFDCIIRYA